MSYSFGGGYQNQQEEDDLYEGYNQTPEGYDNRGYGELQDTVGNLGPPPGTSMRPPPSSLGRGAAPPMTRQMQSSMGGGPGDARPMTAVRAAGYTASGQRPGSRGVFDPAGLAGRGPAPALVKRSDNGPEDMCREMEKQVNALVEESALLNLQEKHVDALEKAKEAGKRERQLCKLREQHGLAEQINIDLTYSVCFNLAHQYQANEMHNEALNTYSIIVKNKQYAQSGRLRVNMGNIYYQQKKYPNAIKMYRMALDQIPNTGKEIRYKIMRNIGNAFVRQGLFVDAIQSFEQIMDNIPDFQTGFNILLCYYALGDKEKMKKHFTMLLNIPREDEEDAENSSEDVLQDDGLRDALKERQKRNDHYISIGSKLLAPVIFPENIVQGYDWVVEMLHTAKHGAVKSEMEIAKAVKLLRTKRFDKAIQTLKSYEKKDQQTVAFAATNLSFIYFHEADYANAIKYADVAMRHNRYNAKALVNKGNCLFMRGEYEMAKNMYQESMSAEADCVEAMYNLGLVNKKLMLYTEALQLFDKLSSIIPHSIEVMYQLAQLGDLTNNSQLAIQWLHRLLTKVPSDPGVLAWLGNIHAKNEDESQSMHYHAESYRYYPTDMQVISWLGAWFVKNEQYEKAVHYFQRAAEIQPGEVKWKLMVASCHRRSNDYQQAFEIYQHIHQEYPENVECLRYLVHICDDLGKKDQVHDYVVKLRKAERALELQAQTNVSPSTQLPVADNFQPPAPAEAATPAYPDQFTGDKRAAGNVNMPAPAPASKKMNPDEDEWGQEELGEDLLPM